MRKILLLSHGNLASELLQSSQMIMGEVVGVSAITLREGEDLKEYAETIKTEILKENDGLLILIDLFGGTPFMQASQIYSELDDQEKIRIVTGVNLPMLLELLSNLREKSLEELACLAEEYGKKGIINLCKTSEVKNGN
uniref:PTS sugar transporter subunit IIA n=1 Tax=Ndongobacter massiliensis TaxID=1871025 RepID=UPI0009314664|nr:PTS sugar transporter subunit IIA [Ndongobacter massiliensis]